MKTATLEKKTVRAKAKHPHELIRRIQKGLSFSELKALQDSIDMPFEQLAAKLSISRSTLQRRKVNGRLSPDEFHPATNGRSLCAAAMWIARWKVLLRAAQTACRYT